MAQKPPPYPLTYPLTYPPWLRLHLLISPHEVECGNWLNCVADALKGGVSVVQLRNKHDTTRECIAQARHLQKLLPPHTPLIINDSVDVAIAVGANGVHLGQNDLPPTRARKFLGARAIIGYSIENPNQLSNQTPDQLPHQLEEYKASDYLGVGPIFATPSKADAAPPLGLDTLAAMASLSSTTPVPPVPVVAIGGISTANVSDVWRTGVAGIAVISAITRATCCQEAARQLLAPSIPLHPTPSPTPSQIADAR